MRLARTVCSHGGDACTRWYSVAVGPLGLTSLDRVCGFLIPCGRDHTTYFVRLLRGMQAIKISEVETSDPVVGVSDSLLTVDSAHDHHKSRTFRISQCQFFSKRPHWRSPRSVLGACGHEAKFSDHNAQDLSGKEHSPTLCCPYIRNASLPKEVIVGQTDEQSTAHTPLSNRWTRESGPYDDRPPGQGSWGARCIGGGDRFIHRFSTPRSHGFRVR